MKRWTAGLAFVCVLAVPTALAAEYTAAAALHRQPVPPRAAAASPAPPPATTTPPPMPPPPTTNPPTTTTTSAPPTVSAAEQAALTGQAVSAVRSVVPGADVGLDVVDLATGGTVAGYAPTQQFASMSVVKLLIAVDALGRANWAPDDATRQNVQQMLSTSDDNIADDMWDAGGDGDIITRDAALMGLTGTAPPSDSGEWGDTQITAQDMVSVYRYITQHIPPAARDLLVNSMAAATKTAADGTDQFFGIPNGLPGGTWAIKQGWGSSGSVADFDTTGLVGANNRFAVVLLVAAPLGDYQSLPGALTAGISALRPALTASP